MLLDVPNKRLLAQLGTPTAAPISLVPCFDEISYTDDLFTNFHQYGDPVSVIAPAWTELVASPALDRQRRVKHVLAVGTVSESVPLRLALDDGVQLFPAGNALLHPGFNRVIRIRGQQDLTGCGQQAWKLDPGGEPFSSEGCLPCDGPVPVLWTITVAGLPFVFTVFDCPFSALNGTYTLTDNSFRGHFCSWGLGGVIWPSPFFPDSPVIGTIALSFSDEIARPPTGGFELDFVDNLARTILAVQRPLPESGCNDPQTITPVPTDSFFADFPDLVITMTPNF